MNGQELYELFKRKHAERGHILDEWGDLEDVDRACWCALAIEILAD